MAQKAVRTITVSLGSQALTGKLFSATVYKGGSVEVDHIAAFGDSEFTNVPRNVKQQSEFTFTILDDGTLASLYNLTGTVATVSLAVTYGDGKTDGTPVSSSMDMAISSVEAGGEISVDGDRKSTIVVKATPHAPATSSDED